jgi:hypothetical protein
MFDAVVIAGADAEPAARTFATLVTGVVEGVVRRATLLSHEDTPELRTLADAAGCRLALGIPKGGFGEALKDHLETAHVITLSAGALLPPDWPNRLRQDLQRRGAPPADAGLAFRPDGLVARLRVTAALTGRARLPLAHGALTPRASLMGRGFDGASVPTGARWAAAHLTIERATGW